jgi:CO/xanthine dehydrogenase FAD-binding subunit
MQPEWLAPTSLEEALSLKAERGEEVTVVAGGTFVGLLVNQRLLAPEAYLSLQRVPGLDFVEANGELRLGALTTHRTVERSPVVHRGWPALAETFGVVASPRVRNQATVGGVLADADHASDPPAMFLALGARAVARSVRGEREIPIEELIVCSWRCGSPAAITARRTASSARARTRTARASASLPADAVTCCAPSSGPSRSDRSGFPSCATPAATRRRSAAPMRRRSIRSRT